jgi:kynurenine 3-monooxygenase
MDYSQEYINDEYIELKIPAGQDADGQPVFLLDPNHLHIWPRHSFMLIALPNKVSDQFHLTLVPGCDGSRIFSQDKTFTCTLFAPISELDGLRTPEAVLSWFHQYFPDALRAIGKEILVKDFFKNPRCPLICTKVGVTPRTKSNFLEPITSILVEALPLQGSCPSTG